MRSRALHGPFVGLPSTETTLRRVADLVRLSLVLGAPVLLLVDGAADAYGMTLLALVAIAARAVRAPASADLLFVGLLAVDGWLTALGAFATFNRNDTIGHVLLPAAVTPMLYHLAVRAAVVRPMDASAPAGRVAAVVVLAALALALGAAWEITEWLSDAALGTNMSLGYEDTLRDLTADATGAVLGALAATHVLRRTGR